MKNKKGFTLIELLAVIVVLAIIALITVPQILGMTSKSRNQASLRSLEGHIRNIDNQLAMDKFQNDTKSGSYTFENLNLENFPKKDHLRCEEYEVNNNVVYEAKNCLIDEKNYCYLDSQVIECSELENTLRNQILADNEVITEKPDFGTSINVSNEKGLYVSTSTNSGQPTYYFRGDVKNNYVKFANYNYDLYLFEFSISGTKNSTYFNSFDECQERMNSYKEREIGTDHKCTKIISAGEIPILWRIVRINEDGTIRLIVEELSQNIYNKYGTALITTGSYNDNYPVVENYKRMYYSTNNSEYSAKAVTEKWYSKNIGSNPDFASKLATGNYFCEEAKFSLNKNMPEQYYGNAFPKSSFMQKFDISTYEPTFKCNMDPNGHQYVNSSVGLITLDEVVFAGAVDNYSTLSNPTYVKNYLHEYGYAYFKTMSPAGYVDLNSSATDGGYNWEINGDGVITHAGSRTYSRLRMVINLKASVMATKEYDEALGVDVYVVE